MTRAHAQVALALLVALLGGWQAALAWEITPPIETPAGQILVHLAPGYENLAATRNLSTSFGAQVSLHANRPGWLTVTTPENVAPEEFAASLRARPEIDGADPHLRCFQLSQPNDPFYRDLDNPDPDTGYDQFYLFDINAEQAWADTTGSSNVTIAIIDSGVSFYHEDLAGHIWTNPGEVADDGIDNDGNGFIDDVHGWDFAGDNVGDPSSDDVASFDNNPNVWDPAWWDDSWGYPPVGETDWWEDPTWTSRLATIDPAIGNTEDDDNNGYGDMGVGHGTNVAGMADAVTNNGLGIAGIGWNSTIMPVRVINAEGWGWGLDAADAIRYAADQGADVINMSFSFGRVDFDNPPAPGEEGYADYLEALAVRDAIIYAAGKGSIIVAAAGNSGDQYQGLDFPADMPETISVGSVDSSSVRSYYSATALPGEELDIVTPGEWVLTTGVLNMTSWAMWRGLGMDWYLGQDTYEQVQGTSFSCPLVSGFAGLYLSMFPNATLDEFRAAIQQSALDLGTSGYDAEYGWGLLDAAGALEYGENIPEPVTASLFVVGVGALALKLRRRRRV